MVHEQSNQEVSAPRGAPPQNLVKKDPPAPTKFKRSSVACRRCRRLRIKCDQGNGTLPCAPCRRAGQTESKTCGFASRGDDEDRKFRIKRDVPQPDLWPENDSPKTPRKHTLALGRQVNSPSTTFRILEYTAADIWKLLPPHEEVVQGCKVFTTNCLQVGFIPKTLFLEELETHRDAINVFLLLSLLSISARFTPDLCERFGGAGEASEFFLELAHTMVPDQMWKMDLQTMQGFFLLGMADWGKGDRNRSSIEMGIAVRMAGVLRLHREETYHLPPNASAEVVVHTEGARRSFWVIQNHDNLYTQQHLPMSFAKADITTLLPAEENDFAFGRIPAARAALAGTQPAMKDPSLVFLPTRSLFATLIQVHDLWGLIARGVHREQDSGEEEIPPWMSNSRYYYLTETMREWEQNMPPAHTWSAWNLRGFKTERIELAYISIVTITRLNNIVLRRSYLEAIAARILDGVPAHDHAPEGFWETMAYELFSNVYNLYEAIDTLFSLRSPEDGFPAMLAFCTYTCGSLSSYLYKWPKLCPDLAPMAEQMLRRSLDVLATFGDKWQIVSHWIHILQQVAGLPLQQKHRAQSEVSTQEAMLNTAASLGTSPGTVRRGSMAASSTNGTMASMEERPSIPLPIRNNSDPTSANSSTLHTVSDVPLQQHYIPGPSDRQNSVKQYQTPTMLPLIPPGIDQFGTVPFVGDAFDNDLYSQLDWSWGWPQPQ